MTDITQPDMVEGEDPFWRSWPSEHQLRDALAGVLHAQPGNIRWVDSRISNINRRTSGWESRRRDEMGRFV